VQEVIRLQTQEIERLVDDDGENQPYSPGAVQPASRCSACQLAALYCSDAMAVQGTPAENGCDSADDDSVGDDDPSYSREQASWKSMWRVVAVVSGVAIPAVVSGGFR